MLAADHVAQFSQLFAAEFDDLAGGHADEVIVGLASHDHVVVGLLVVEKNLLENAGILQMGTGFWPSKILLTASEVQLFTHLARTGGMSARDIKELLKLNCMDRYL